MGIVNLPLRCHTFGPVAVQSAPGIFFQITLKFRFLERNILTGTAHNLDQFHRRFLAGSTRKSIHQDGINNRGLMLQHETQFSLFKFILLERPPWSSVFLSSFSPLEKRNFGFPYILYFLRLQCFITICISIARHYLFRSAQQICNKNILKCCVCFRESFPVCQSLITGTQMLNPHFSLWTFDWNNNPLFIPRHDRLLSG